jgi:RHS repeat-associated protein
MEQRTPFGTETAANATPRVSKYVYDFGGRMIKEIYPSGREVSNEFESDGDLQRIFGKVNSNATERTYANSFSYTPDGRIEKLRLGNGLWESAKFNTRLQVTELALGHSVGDGGLWKLGYDYGELDANGNVDVAKNTGNIAKQTVSFNGLTAPMVQTFKYDSLFRLTEARETANSAQNWKQQFGYDRFGNRLTHNKFIGTTQITLDNKTHPTIDAATNRFNLGQGFVYDKNGNLTNDAEGRGFTFNGENKQTVVMNGNVKVGEYFYDGENKRVKKKVYNPDGVTLKEETIFVYSAGKLIAEYSTAQPPQNPTTSYTATDQLGSPRVITNSLGAVVSRRDFMPFGEELYNNIGERTTNLKYGTIDSVRQKFTGYLKDDETGLDFAEARMYENRHARFTAVDPLLASGKSANPQTFNRYVYVMNNPLAYTDPTGLQVGRWMVPSGSGRYKYVVFGRDIPKDENGNEYVNVTETNRSGDLIGSAEGYSPNGVARFNPFGPGSVNNPFDLDDMLFNGPFVQNGWEIIRSDEYSDSLVEPITGVRDVSLDFYSMVLPVAQGGKQILGATLESRMARISAESGENLVLRTMKVADDGFPLIGESATSLGPRPTDVRNGIGPGLGGMSVTPAGGTLPNLTGKNLQTFCIPCKDLGPKLNVRLDPKNPINHAFVEAVESMTYHQYQRFIWETRLFWKNHDQK